MIRRNGSCPTIRSNRQPDGQRRSPAAGGCCSIRLFTPLQPGWMDEVDRVIEVIRPTSWKGYTIGDPLSPQTTKYPLRLDDEKLMYPFYEKAVKAGITNICIHKGLLPKDYETSIPGGAWKYATVDDVPKAAKDWPQINFIIYHSCASRLPGEPDRRPCRVRTQRQYQVGIRPRGDSRRNMA